MAGFFPQLKALLWRNILLKKRNKGRLFQELFMPIYFVAILAMIKALTKPDLKPSLTFPVYNFSEFGYPFSSSSKIYVAPNTSTVNGWMQDVVAQLDGPPTYELFASAEDAESEYRSSTTNVAAGIIFDYDGSSTSYAIRTEYGELPGASEIFNFDGGKCRNSDGTKDYNCAVNKYLSKGFIQLQLAVDNVLLKSLGISTPNPTNRLMQVQMMDKGEFQPDTAYVQTISSIYFVFSFCVLANFLAVNIVAEKEKKIKEGMLMMGLRSSVFWLSWSLIYLVLVMIASAAMIIIIYASDFFSQSNLFLLYVMFVTYGTSFIALAFMITPLFKKAKTAGAVTGFGTVIVSCLYLAVSQTRDSGSYDSKVSPGVQWLMCLLSPISFAAAIDQAIFLDIHHEGLGFDSWLTYGQFPIIIPILMLLGDTILYAMLTVYLDRVVPSEYGTKYHPLYCFMPSYWFPSRRTTSHADALKRQHSLSQADVEPVPPEMEGKVAMKISGLTKSFTVKKKEVNAVNGFWLDIYEGQITCLLGHNGAGKTTLMNMLTGVVPPTSGNATVKGYDVSNTSDMEMIRRQCGICPQHNILYEELSCREHLEVFANIKGVPADEVESAVKKSLKDVDLSSQMETFAKDLSGGQKRKLSVAIALIGDPKLIFLDEPTAGMDPFSRRHLWSLLKQRKEGRVVLLTTHFMDEADILADRKAFIRKGKLRCCGSSLFLKSKFGIGYHLTMVVSQFTETSRVTSLLHSMVPTIEHDRSHGNELAYTIPLSDVPKFADLFGTLEENSASLGILSYGVSMTTLEEVFLKLEGDELVEEEEEEDGSHEFMNNTYQRTNQDEVNLTVNSIEHSDEKYYRSVLTGKELSKQRFWALMKIRFLLTIRNGASLFFQIFLPVALLLAGLIVAKTANTVTPSDTVTPLTISPNMYVNTSSSLPDLLVFDSLNSAGSQAIINEFKTDYGVDTYASGTQNTSDVAPHYVGLQLNGVSGQTLMSFVAMYNDSALHSLAVALNLATQNILNISSIAQQISITNLPWPEVNPKMGYNSNGMNVPLLVGLAFVLIIPGFSSDIVRDREHKLRSQLRISGLTFNLYWGSTYILNLLVYMVPCILMIIIILALQIDGFNSAGAIGALILLFLTNLPFNVLFGLVLSFLFDKAESTIAYLPQLLNFAGILPFIAVSIVDMVTQGDAAIILHYLFCIIDPPYLLMGGIYFIYKIYLKEAYLNQTPDSGDYFKFNNHIMIAVIMPLIHVLWMYWLLRILDLAKMGGKIVEAFPCCVSSIEGSTTANYDVMEDEDDDVKEERQRVERLATDNSMACSRSSGRDSFINQAYTSNVELDNVDCQGFSPPPNSGHHGSEAPVAYMAHLRKTFEKRTKSSGMCKKDLSIKVKHAVRNLSIGVNKGEVFGLLGPNGAGKSTALSMVTAEVAPSAGKVVISGENVRTHALSVIENLGFCPQHDALWELITLEEHIRCFATIKGVMPTAVDNLVDFYIKSLKLEEHRSKKSKELSGGTKRKLCYILSMLGSPHLVLLDEPSTGMDPQSKRFLWDTISTSFHNTSRGAILTTHYMEEADALCDRVGIMVNGQLWCLGSTQHLKGKFGSGYILEVKLRLDVAGDVEALMDKLEDHLRSLFRNMEQVERFMERAQYSIPRENVRSLSKTFASLEACKTSHHLEEYNFSQSTLEQVFLYFAKQQLEEEEADAKANGTENGKKPLHKGQSFGAPIV